MSRGRGHSLVGTKEDVVEQVFFREEPPAKKCKTAKRELNTNFIFRGTYLQFYLLELFMIRLPILNIFFLFIKNLIIQKLTLFIIT